ncbi:MAG: hypothetical protein F6K62_11995 [Sphaerospermopsis sp. SIO1G2]|nr:hypothetical protein [Sphaerospermopsis sp. SIO1G2]
MSFHRFLYITTLLTFVAVASLAYAGEQQHAPSHKRVDHYAASKPASADHAIQQYYLAVGAIGQILSGDDITTQELEAIHARSYELEAALAVLAAAQPQLGGLPLTSLKSHVEALHLASEDHHAEKTRAHFSALEHVLISTHSK